MIELSLRIFHAGASWHGEYSLYSRAVDWPFLPRSEDVIEIVENADGEWFGHTSIARVFFQANGRVLIELQPIRIDPAPEVDTDSMGWKRHVIWRSDQDGDLQALLQDSGWELYRS